VKAGAGQDGKSHFSISLLSLSLCSKRRLVSRRSGSRSAVEVKAIIAEAFPSPNDLCSQSLNGSSTHSTPQPLIQNLLAMEGEEFKQFSMAMTNYIVNYLTNIRNRYGNPSNSSEKRIMAPEI